jgi:hypothetical protein
MKRGEALLPLHPIPTAKPNFQSGSFYLAKNRNFLLGLDMGTEIDERASPGSATVTVGAILRVH